MNFEKLLSCPKCNLLYDKSLHIPRTLPNCYHSICSKCIRDQICKNNNFIICPIDKMIYENINSLEKLQINEKLVEEINNSKNNNLNKSNRILITDLDDISIGNEILSKNKLFKTETSDINQSSFNANTNSSLFSTFFNLKIKNDNISICPIHSMPNNIICINDKIKMCVICSKTNLHMNHQVLTEDELLKQIEKLIDIYQEIEKKNLIFNRNFQDISKKDISKIIDDKIDKLKDSINLTKNDIINNINIQIEQIIYYLDFRKNELKNKYITIFNEIKELKMDVLDWKKVTTNKLDKLNEINNISSECLKLLDTESDNNFNNLFMAGNSLNEKYNYLKENLDNLIKFCEIGININPNNDLIDIIKFTYTKKKNNYQRLNGNLKNENKNHIVNSKLYKIIEDNKLAKELNLTQFTFEQGIINSLNKSYDINKESISKEARGSNIEIKDNLNPIITLKQNYNNNIYNNYNSYNYNYQNETPHNINQNSINYNLSIKANSPNIKRNSKKKDFPIKIDNKEKIHYYKILPNLIKKKNLNERKNHEKKLTCNLISESINKLNKITPSSARNKKINKTYKNEKISGLRNNATISKNLFPLTTKAKKRIDIENSKLSNIIKIDNISFQDSFNNMSSAYYLPSIFDKNLNNSTNEISKIKEKQDNENSTLNLSKINGNTNKSLSFKKNSKNFELSNLIISQLKSDSPNFNGHNINGKGIGIFCNMIQKKQNIKFNELLMEHCDLNDDDANLLLKTLIEKNVELEILDLSWNKITDQSGLCILDLIKENKSLNILLLNNNLFSPSLKEKFESYVNLGGEGLDNIKLYI